uniref:Putative chromosome condensation complex condensin subunit g n=1 Tax=Xenopsylla cheopis TaxID=163159 RepID=A0A6M2DZN9_XENCH
MHFLIRSFLQFLIEISYADYMDTRKVSLQFISILLGTLDGRTIDDDIFNDLAKCVLERIKDVNSKVRAEAIHAGRRLQNVGVEDDLICKSYKFHMKSDPSASVRRATLDCIGYSIFTREAIIARIMDVNEGIRLLAFKRIYEMPLKSLKLVQRHKLLYLGMRDKSVKVKTYIENSLLPFWLEQSDKSLLILIDNIRHDITTNNKKENDFVIEKVLNAFFKKKSFQELIAELKLDQETKLISVKLLTVHLIIYWHRLTAFFMNSENDYDVDLIAPTLPNFVGLIQDYDNFWASVMALDNPTEEQKLDQLDYNIGKLELLRMIQLHDYMVDEVGRVKLNEYLLHNLLHQKSVIEDHYFIIIEILYKSCLNFMTWQTKLLNIINEIYESATTSNLPEKVPPTSMETSHTFEVKKANLRIDIIDLETQREEALVNKDYIKMKDCDDQLSAQRTKLKKLYSDIGMELLEDNSVESQREITDNSKDIIKTLIIFYGMVGLFDIKTTPEMNIILENIVNSNLNSDNSEIEYWALRCAGAISIKNKNLAKTYFPLFFTKMFSSIEINPPEQTDPISAPIEMISDEYHLIPDVALQIVFDMVMAHSIKSFEVPNFREDGNDGNNQACTNLNETEKIIFQRMSLVNRSVSTTFINILMKLLHDSEFHSTRLIVVQGLVKMFLLDKIVSNKIVGHLLLMYHHPEMGTYENNDIRQSIVLLFSAMGSGMAGGPNALINAIMPVLMIWNQAPSSSSLKHIDCFDILKLIIALTSSNITDSNCIHNDLALKLCEALKYFSGNEELELILSKALSICNIHTEGQLKLDMRSCVSQLLTATKNKLSTQYLEQVLVNIERGFIQANVDEENDIKED